MKINTQNIKATQEIKNIKVEAKKENVKQNNVSIESAVKLNISDAAKQKLELEKSKKPEHTREAATGIATGRRVAESAKHNQHGNSHVNNVKQGHCEKDRGPKETKHCGKTDDKQPKVQHGHQKCETYKHSTKCGPDKPATNGTKDCPKTKVPTSPAHNSCGSVSHRSSNNDYYHVLAQFKSCGANRYRCGLRNNHYGFDNRQMLRNLEKMAQVVAKAQYMKAMVSMMQAAIA